MNQQELERTERWKSKLVRTSSPNGLTPGGRINKENIKESSNSEIITKILYERLIFSMSYILVVKAIFPSESLPHHPVMYFHEKAKAGAQRSDLQRLELSFRPLRLQLSALILQWHLQDVASSDHFLPLQGGHRGLGDFSSEVEGEEGGLEDVGEGEGATEGVGEGVGRMEVVGGGGGICREDGGEGVGDAWFLEWE